MLYGFDGLAFDMPYCLPGYIYTSGNSIVRSRWCIIFGEFRIARIHSTKSKSFFFVFFVSKKKQISEAIAYNYSLDHRQHVLLSVPMTIHLWMTDHGWGGGGWRALQHTKISGTLSAACVCFVIFCLRSHDLPISIQASIIIVLINPK